MPIHNRLDNEIEMLKARVKTLEEVLLAVNAKTAVNAKKTEAKAKTKKSTSKK